MTLILTIKSEMEGWLLLVCYISAAQIGDVARSIEGPGSFLLLRYILRRDICYL
jgi:hypothetical protein